MHIFISWESQLCCIHVNIGSGGRGQICPPYKYEVCKRNMLWLVQWQLYQLSARSDGAQNDFQANVCATTLKELLKVSSIEISGTFPICDWADWTLFQEMAHLFSVLTIELCRHCWKSYFKWLAGMFDDYMCEQKCTPPPPKCYCQVYCVQTAGEAGLATRCISQACFKALSVISE